MNCLFSRRINLPRLITHLKTEKHLRDPLVSKIKKVAYANFLLLSKIFNFIFGDHHWHSRSKGEELLARYQNTNPEQRSDAEISDLIDLLGIDDPDFPKIKPLHVDDRTHFHLQANEFGQNSALEGAVSFPFISGLSNFMSTFSPQVLHERYGINPDLKQEIQHCITLSFFWMNPKKLQAKIQEAIRLNKNLLIQGGWVGLPTGHAIYYEVVPQTNGSIHFRLYNLGAGAETYHGIVKEGDKSKAAPGIEWRNISREKILNLKTLEALIEFTQYTLTIGPKESQQLCSYGPSDLYETFRSLLEPAEETLLYSPEGDAATVQYSGICAWRSLQAFLRVKLSTPQYKRLMLDLKLSSLVELSSDKLLRLTPKVHHWHLAKKSFKKVCRRVDHAVRKGLVTEAYAARAKTCLKSVECWISAHKLVLTRRNQFSPGKICDRMKARLHAMRLPIAVPKEPPLHTLFQMPAVEILTATRVDQQEQMKVFHLHRETPLNTLQNLRNAAEYASTAWRENHGDHGLHVAVMQYIRTIPVDLEFWTAACGENKEFLQDIAAQMRVLREIAFKTSFMTAGDLGAYPEQIFAQQKLTHLFRLLNYIFNPEINDYLISVHSDEFYEYGHELCPDFPPLPSRPKDKHPLIYNPSRHNSGNSDPGEKRDPHLDIRYATKDNGPVSLKYMPNLLNFFQVRDPEYYNELFRALQFEPGKGGLNYFRMLESENLSPALLGYRDAYLSYYWLSMNFSTPSQNINRDQDLNFRLDVMEEDGENRSSHLKIYVNGITFFSDDAYHARQSSLRNSRPFHSTLTYDRQIKDNNNLSKLYYEYPQNEIWILQEATELASSNEGMLLEEYRELFHLKRLTKNSRFEMLAYFSKNPTKLQDLNYQIFFKKTLFSHPIQELWYPRENASDSRFMDLLQNMMEEQFANAFQEGQIQTCVFFNQIAGILKTYYPEDNRVFGNIFEKFQELLARPSLKEHHKSVIYGGLLEYLNTQERLSESQCFYALRAIRHLARYPISEKWSDLLTVKQARDFPFKHAQALMDFFGLNDNLDQEKIRNVLNEERFEQVLWEVDRRGASPVLVTSEGAIRYDLFTGEMTDTLIHKLIPSNIINHPTFKKVFPKTLYCESIHNGIVYILENGQENYVQMKNGKLLIDQKRGERWYRYLDKIDLIPHNQHSIYPQYLYDAYEHWTPVDQLNQILFCDPLTKRAVYTMSRWTSGIRECETGLMVQFPSARFSSFESPFYIQEWCHSSPFGFVLPGRSPVKMELPRYGLTFDLVNDERGGYTCREFPGFRLKEGETLPSLGTCSHYLILENDRGVKKVIIPRNLPIESGDVKFEVLAPNYDLQIYHRDARTYKSLSYFSYDVDDLNRLSTPSTEGMLLLALSLALAQKYTGAAHVLRQMNLKLTPYTDAELEVLESIIRLDKKNGDISGNALAIQVYAIFLKIKNANILKECSLEDKRNYQKTVKDYLTHRPNAVALLLTPDEENYLREQLQIRSAPLSLSSASSSSIAASSVVSSVPLKNDVSDSDWKNGVISQHLLEPRRDPIQETRKWSEKIEGFIRKLYLLTRPDRELNTYFLHYYERAAHGTDAEKNEIFVAAAFLKNSNDEWRLIGSYLQYVIRNPEEYPRNGKTLPLTKELCLERASNLQSRGLLDESDNTSRTDRRYTPTEQNKSTVIQESVFVPIPFSFEPLQKRSIGSLAKHLFVSEKTGLRGNREPIGWLAHERESHQSDNPLAARECERLVTDFQALSQENEGTFSLQEGALQELKEILENGRDENQEAIKRLKREILSLANKKSDNKSTAALAKIQEWGGRKKISLDQVLISFALKRPELIQRKNPLLNQEDFHRLYSIVAEMIQHSTYEQQRNRCLKALKKVERCDPNEAHTRNAFVQQLAKAVMTERVEEVYHNPPLLVFEYYSQKILWPKQVESLKLFLERKSENIVRQMIMGSGKSEVLIPLLALLRADGNDLSLLVVPQPLFENVSTATQKIIKDAFGQTLQTLYFDRNTTFTETKLQTILNDLRRIKESKEALIMTSKSIQCLLLKYIEEAERYYQGASTDGVSSAKFDLLGSILKLLAEQGNPIFDEADTLLNILHEVCFSMGKIYPPQRTEVEFLFSLYRIVLEDSPYHLDCNPTIASEERPLTDESYHADWKLQLIERVITFFKNVRFGDMDLTSEEVDCLRGLSEDFLRDYLTRNEKSMGLAQQTFDAIPSKKIKNLLAVASEQLNHLLPFTLVKISREHYGVDPSGSTSMAIPYAFADQPKIGSQFANPYITINYTFQHYLKHGVSIAQLKRETDRLKDQAKNEILKSGGQLPLEMTEAWKVFCHLRGNLDIPLFRVKEKHLRMIQERVNNSSDAKLHFVSHVILPQMQLSDQKLVCNPINLISFFKFASGFTGTLWNSKSMHRKLTPLPESGTDAKTIDILWRHSMNEVLTIEETEPSAIIQRLSTIPHEILIDGGGYIKSTKNSVMAHAMSRASGLPTVFYHENGEKMITEGDGEIPLSQSTVKPDQRKTFLDQSHTVGADVVQKIDAVGIVTVGRHVLLRDLLQHVWRLRGLAESQRVKFALSAEVKNVICSELNLTENEPILFSHLLAFAIRNQARRQGNDTYKAFVDQLWSVPQQLFLDVLLSDAFSAQEKRAAYQQLKSTWIKEVPLEASEMLGKIPLITDVIPEIDVQIEKCRRFMKEIYEACPFLGRLKEEDEVLREFEEIKCQIMEPSGASSSAATSAATSTAPSIRLFVPKKVLNRDTIGDETTDREMSTEKELNTEMETQEQINSEKPTYREWSTLNKYHLVSPSQILTLFQYTGIPVFSLGEVFRMDKNFLPIAEMFSNIQITATALQPDRYQEGKFGLFGPWRVPFHNVMINNLGIIICAGEDTIRTDDPNEISYQLDLGPMNQSSRPLTFEEREAIVKIKFLNGESQFTREEMELLQNWIARYDRKVVKSFYEKYVLSGFPGKTSLYQNSALRRLLNAS